MAGGATSIARRTLRALGTLGVAITIVLPLFAAWVASSFVAFAGGPTFLAAIAGAAILPVGPVAWEIWAWRRARGTKTAPATARGLGPRWARARARTRLGVRATVLGAAALGALLAWRPADAFTALALRGDWMLDGETSTAANLARRTLLGAAGGLEWLYELAHPNVYEDTAARDEARRVQPPAPPRTTSRRTKVEAPVPGDARASRGEWPVSPAVHPAVANLPASAETSPSAVAAHLAEHEPDPRGRVKAIHDYIATRVSYDTDLARAHTRGQQSVETVFRDRRAVCAGYARLFVEMAKSVGLEAVYLTGDARRSDGTEAVGGHAWNAVRLADGWSLVDVTWDAGAVDASGAFVPELSSSYLFTPPEIFGVSHFPREVAWQLREAPLDRAAFLRAPMLLPRFFTLGMQLVAPERGRVSGKSDLVVQVDNPRLAELVAEADTRGPRAKCAREGHTTLRCAFERPGAATLRVFAREAGAPREAKFDQVAAFQVEP